MTLKVMNADDGNLKRKTKGSGYARPHQQRPGQSGPACIGNGVHIRQCLPGFLQRFPDKRQHPANVIPGGKFGHHAAIFSMHFCLRVECMMQQPLAGVIQRYAGLVAGSFNAEHEQGSSHRDKEGKRNKVSLYTSIWVLLYNSRLSLIRLAVLFRPARPFIFINLSERNRIFMTTIKVKENEPFEVAMRRFKRTIEKSGLLTELRAREFYEKPTAERKRKLAAAVKRTYKRLRSQLLPPKLY